MFKRITRLFFIFGIFFNANYAHAIIQAMYTAASGADSAGKCVDVNANNIANVNTVGHKAHKANIASNFYYELVHAGATSTDAGGVIPAGVAIGTGAHVQSVYRMNAQGSLDHTENQYDLAIHGRGFFVIMGAGENGTDAYTRDGTFSLNQNGDLVSATGHLVAPGINIPQNAVDIQINRKGLVQYKLQGNASYIDAGTIQLANFVNENGLKEIGDNLLIQTNASGAAILGNAEDSGFGTIRQGYQEASNVSLITEMTNLVKNQRAFQANMRVLNIGDQMLDSLVR